MKTSRKIFYILLLTFALFALVSCGHRNSGAPSSFTVEFHNGDSEYVLQGCDTVKVSSMLAEIGFAGDMTITSVTFSDTTLVEVYMADEEWALRSLAPFNTAETLTVECADGEVLEIPVTDANYGDGIEVTLVWTKKPAADEDIEAHILKVYKRDGIYPYSFTIINESGTTICSGKSSDDAPTETGILLLSNKYWFQLTNLEGAARNTGDLKGDFGDYNYNVVCCTPTSTINGARFTITAHPTLIGEYSSYSIRQVSEFVRKDSSSEEFTRKRNVVVKCNGVQVLTKNNITFPARTADNYEAGNVLAATDIVVYDVNGSKYDHYEVTCSGTTYTVELNTEYTVAYNGNGSTSGSMDDQTFLYGTAQNLRANAFSRTLTVSFDGQGGTPASSSLYSSSTFNGWATSASGSVVYPNVQSVNNLTTTPYGTVTLYANWTDNAITLPDATKTNYTFKGWYTSASGGTRVGGAGDSYVPTSTTVTLYAQWELANSGITITRSGLSTGESAIYTVVGGGVYYTVVLTGENASVTLADLPTDTYTVTENSWSWTSQTPVSQTAYIMGGHTFSFTASKKADQPLNAESSMKNW